MTLANAKKLCANFHLDLFSRFDIKRYLMWKNRGKLFFQFHRLGFSDLHEKMLGNLIDGNPTFMENLVKIGGELRPVACLTGFDH